MSAEWIRASLKIEPSEFGCKVADMVGDWQSGIYHLDQKALKRADWRRDDYIELIVRGTMATYDFDTLTRLAILAHDYGIRTELEAASWKHIRLIFYNRDWQKSSSPTMEQAIERVRRTSVLHKRGAESE